MANPAQIDELIDTAQRFRPDCRPGERVVAGRPYVYDAELLLSFIARENIRSAPADLTGLSDEALDLLRGDCMRRHFDTQAADTYADELHERAFAEKSRRTGGSLARRSEALQPIPVLGPITVAVRALDPAAWGAAVFGDDQHIQAAE